MKTTDAFALICEALKRSPRKRFLDAHYDEEMFGNFVINFEDDGRPTSIVNDRLELVLYNAFGGEGAGKTILSSLRDADEATVQRALNL